MDVVGIWGFCVDEMKSTFHGKSYVFAWSLKKQQSVAQSPVKVYYVSTALVVSYVTITIGKHLKVCENQDGNELCCGKR